MKRGLHACLTGSLTVIQPKNDAIPANLRARAAGVSVWISDGEAMSKYQGAASRHLFMLAGIVCGCLGLTMTTSAQRHGAQSDQGVRYAWADVLRVDPVHERVQVREPREECDDNDYRYSRDADHSAAGTVIGALVGGALGNTLGKGDGRRAATVAGAVVGGAVGHSTGSRQSAYSAPRCHIVDTVGEESRLIGYDVQYRYRGDVYGSRLQNDPGDRIRVRVIVEPAE